MFKVNAKTASFAAAATLMLATPAPAFAYMGAGAGLSAIGSILSFLGVFLLMLFGFVWFPLKRAFNRRKNKSQTADTSENATADETESAS